MSRAILVLGVPRSGTSAVAGALHRMGVDMGEGHLQPADGNNPGGYYEDLRWQRLNKVLTGERYGHREPVVIDPRQAEQYEKLAEVCEAKPLWGMKDPRLCFVAQFIWVHLEEPRLVVVHRAAQAVTASLMLHSRRSYHGQYEMTLEQAEALRETWETGLRRRLREFQGPVTFIRYEGLLAEPEQTLRRLGRFAFEGLAPRADIDRALAFVDPGCSHHG